MRHLIQSVRAVDPLVVTGKVAAVSGLLIEARGGLSRLSVGARAEIVRGAANDPLPAEVVGFRDSKALLMPFGPVEGVSPGADIRLVADGANVRPTTAWLGRIVDAFGEPIDGKGPLTNVGSRRLEVQAPGIMGRKPVHEPLQRQPLPAPPLIRPWLAVRRPSALPVPRPAP